MSVGKIITVTGPDRVGKTCLVQHLVDFMNSQLGIETVSMKFPYYADTSDEITAIIMADAENAAEDVQFLCQMDRIRSQPIVEDYINRGVYVVCDRYDVDSLFYGLATGVPLQTLLYICTDYIKHSDAVFRVVGNKFDRPVDANLDIVEKFVRSRSETVGRNLDKLYTTLRLPADWGISFDVSVRNTAEDFLLISTCLLKYFLSRGK